MNLNKTRNFNHFFSFNRRKMHTSSQERNPFVVPGATVATILMLGALHARRMYNDKKIEAAKEIGVELELQPDVKAKFLNMLPLRSISRFWGSLTSTELPVWLRPNAHRAWARAFHSNLEEVALPLDQYASLKDFFVRALKEGSRPIDSDPHSLVSPVDGTIMRVGELKEGVLIEQVKGFSYSVSSLLGSGSFFPLIAAKEVSEDSSLHEKNLRDEGTKSWWRISLASPLFIAVSFTVLYTSGQETTIEFTPQLIGMCFSGVIFLVVLEGRWQEGYMAIAAIGATNIGSIKLFIEPDLRTNQPRKKLLQSEAPEERVYEPEGTGLSIKKGEEVAVFNMGSTVVLVFQAPALKKQEDEASLSEFRFCVDKGDKIRMGEALGRWHDL